MESYSEAKSRFLSGDYSVENFFKQNSFDLEYAYCKLLQGDAQTAATYFRKLQSCDNRANWGLCLLQFVNCYVTNPPTYFQIRNFLEIDLNLLINAGQAQFVENIINGADIFYSINPESYKFISRVMLYNDFPEIALYFLSKAKDKFYSDPEMHFMLANCYLKQNNVQSAIESLNNCLGILPAYFPAKNLLLKLNCPPA